MKKSLLLAIIMYVVFGLGLIGSIIAAVKADSYMPIQITLYIVALLGLVTGGFIFKENL